jgi:hypothetical protein
LFRSLFHFVFISLSFCSHFVLISRSVQKVVDSIEGGESWVVMPFVLRVLPFLIRITLPPEVSQYSYTLLSRWILTDANQVSDFLMDAMGGNDSMKTFRGRPGSHNHPPAIRGESKNDIASG